MSLHVLLPFLIAGKIELGCSQVAKIEQQYGSVVVHGSGLIRL